MFGNPSNSNGGISPFGAMGEVIDNVGQFREKRDAELRHLSQVQQMGRAHHQEMMDLIGQYNELREKFQKLEDNAAFYEADRDAACSVIKELRTRLGISKEEVISELDNRRNSILKERGYEYMCD